MTAELADDPWAGFPAGWPACACGCGLPCKATDRTETSKGLKKGDPRKYHCPDCRYKGTRKKVDATGTRVCTICGTERPNTEFISDIRRADGIGRRCRPCENERRRKVHMARQPEHRRLGDGGKRKLPTYDVLKRHYVEEGMSLSEIAKKYKVSNRGVLITLKARAERRGEWPLLTDRERSRRRGHQLNKHAQRTIEAMVLRELCRDYIAEHGMTYVAFAVHVGCPEQYIRYFLARRRPAKRITIQRAVQIMEAIEEPVPEWMRRFVTTAAKKAVARANAEARGLSTRQARETRAYRAAGN